ncbi:acyl-CoA dehydrogenase family protein [Mycobacterium sp. ITM-2016-00316]|uniref:acyl-CoA dehydrogenase family protein n=1 Tax=Mycobacterium sp. ITM-2016-00316 TaxID=2099695 RepID=UPI001E3CFE71|nr:acyl-CoA dehydrogenase family protein [Mycobacterium sp. ITM-2016-00316]WNG79689.1 acyl-CoA dehydrogenase family protein [Mycobacterium sp. ITM-2016-00316]
MTTSDTHHVTAVDTDLVSMIDTVFADHRESRPADSAPGFDAELWHKLDELGLVRLTESETTGGSGAGWAEAAELMSAAVRHGARIPLPEHDLLAGWMLGAAGLPTTNGVRTICVLDGAGQAAGVPWASAASSLVAVWPVDGGHRVAEIASEQARISPGTNLIGEPRDRVSIDLSTLKGTETTPALVGQLHLKSALVRSIQVCAALQEIVNLAIEHTSSRTQFGRTLSKFQAMQHLMSDAAAEITLAQATTESALTAAITSDWSADSLEFLIAVSRSCTGHAATVVVRNAHQAFGAIGTTLEHRLHEYTRPALAWRSEFGSVQSWDERVMRAAVDAGGAGLWRLIADSV